MSRNRAVKNEEKTGLDAATGALEQAFVASVLRSEAQAIELVAQTIGDRIHPALELFANCHEKGGSILVTGLGKSGIIGAKISATLASLGIPSHFIHPSEAAHGDLGRFRRTDCVLALSNSGETQEVVTLVSVLRQDNVPVVSITGGRGGSTLGRVASVDLPLGVTDEVTGFGLAPTCSTTASLALGDALALALAKWLSVTVESFRRNHPGGTLGELLRPVVEVLRFRVGENLPAIRSTRTVREALQDADTKGRRPGALVVVDDASRLIGIFTDGDLRRLVLTKPELLDGPIASVMTRSPRTLGADALVRDAVQMVREFRADEIPVIDADGRPVGLLDVQDLVALKVVRDD